MLDLSTQQHLQAWLQALPPQPVTRFAPSPTGYLHRGHLLNALLVWGFARYLGGKVLLRMEDHDRQRCRPAYEQAILDDLDWLGLVPDQPTLADFRSGQPTRFRQSDQNAHYQDLLKSLSDRNLVYGCDLSRKQVLALDPHAMGDELRFAGWSRNQNLGLRPEFNWRLRVPTDAHFAFVDGWLGPQTQHPWVQCGDFALRDRHGNWTYQFAAVADDLAQGVSCIIRGQDILPSTGRQLYLRQLLAPQAQPIFFLHHPLLVDANGQKFSKRFFAESLSELRQAGASPQALAGEVLHLAGLVPTPEPLDYHQLENWLLPILAI